jgi:hypothetical protein
LLANCGMVFTAPVNLSGLRIGKLLIAAQVLQQPFALYGVFWH